MKTCVHVLQYLTEFVLECEICHKKAIEKIRTLLCSIIFSETCAIYEIMLKNIVEPDRPQMTT
jgi:hypothetical protein